MPVTVVLREIADALEMHFDQYRWYLDLKTGEVKRVNVDLLSAAEDSQEEDDDDWELAMRIVTTDGFRRLPSQGDVNEWQMMEDFANSLTDTATREGLFSAIHGSGAFRRFRSMVECGELREPVSFSSGCLAGNSDAVVRGRRTEVAMT